MDEKMEMCALNDAVICAEEEPHGKPFEWNGKKMMAAAMLAQGVLSKRLVAAQLGVDDVTLYRWRQNPDFAAEVRRLSRETGLALHDERMAAMKRCAEIVRSELETRFTDPEHLAQFDTLRLIRVFKDLLRFMESSSVLVVSRPAMCPDTPVVSESDEMSDAEAYAEFLKKDSMLTMMGATDEEMEAFYEGSLRLMDGKLVPVETEEECRKLETGS